MCLTQLALALFVAADKAWEIERDLREQALQYGKHWHLWQLLLTCTYLAAVQLRQESGKLILVSYAVYELVLKLNWMVLLPAKRYVQFTVLENSTSFVLSAAMVNSVSALLIGAVLVRLSSRHGFLILLLASGLMLGRTALLQSWVYAMQIAVFALTPGIVGALLAKWRELSLATPTCSVQP